MLEWNLSNQSDCLNFRLYVYKSINETSFVFHSFPEATFKSRHFCRKRPRYMATKRRVVEPTFN
jgi:hypothetical protein